MSNGQFNKKTEQAYSAEKATKARSEATLRDSIRLLSTGSIPELAEGSHSTLSSRPKGSSQAAVFRSRLQRDSLVFK